MQLPALAPPGLRRAPPAPARQSWAEERLPRRPGGVGGAPAPGGRDGPGTSRAGDREIPAWPPARRPASPRRRSGGRHTALTQHLTTAAARFTRPAARCPPRSARARAACAPAAARRALTPPSPPRPAPCPSRSLNVQARASKKGTAKAAPKKAAKASAGPIEWYGPNRPTFLGPFNGGTPAYLTGEFPGDYVSDGPRPRRCPLCCAALRPQLQPPACRCKAI